MQPGLLLAVPLSATALILGTLRALLAPLVQACPTYPDGAGVLMAQVQATIEHVHAALGHLSAQALTDPLTGAATTAGST